MKKCRLLLEEYKAGIWTCDEYQKKVHELDGQQTSAVAESSSHGSTSANSPQSLQSPCWWIEDEDELPEEDDIHA